MSQGAIDWGQSLLEVAQLRWADDVAVNAEFEDIYFSKTDPVAESDYVFVAGNQLADRFRAWSDERPFVIGETGFGSGLNMLRAAECFIATAPACARLHCVSLESRPMTPQDAAKILASADLRGDCLQALIDQWPLPVVGVTRIQLHSRITLDLHLGDAAAVLSDWDASVDAWFLDGFAPACNPAMWRADVLNAVAARSRPTATLATFTSAGWVRRGLEAAGFACRRVAGFGNKRSMLCADRLPDADPPSSGASNSRPVWAGYPKRAGVPGEVAVIGAGLAGTTVAHALAERGVTVSVYDPAGAGGGASGNQQAATHVQLPAETDTSGAFYVAALRHTLAWLARIDPERRLWRDCGLLQLATSHREAQRQRRVAACWQLPPTLMRSVDRTEANDLAGVSVGGDVRGGLYFPGAGWVASAALCDWLLSRHGLSTQREQITNLSKMAGGWRLTTDDGMVRDVDTVVVAAAEHASTLCPDIASLQSIRGQVSSFDAGQLAGGLTPDCVVCAESYVMPTLDSRLTVGASYAPDDLHGGPRAADDAANVAGLDRALPDLGDALRSVCPSDRRVAWRAASPDRLPLVGPIPNRSQWLADYAALRRDAKTRLETPPTHQPGLWLSAGHASRGAVSAPLAAEIVASAICAEPMPVSQALIDTVNPGRTIVSALRRGQG